MHNNVGNSYRLEGNLSKAREHLEIAREMMSNMFGDEKKESKAKVSVRLICCAVSGRKSKSSDNSAGYFD